MENVKKCSLCAEIKSLSKFYIHKKTGRPFSACIDCNLEKKRKERLQKNGGKLLINRPFIENGVVKKKCYLCQEIKLIEAFYESNPSECKECISDRKKKHYAKNKEAICLDNESRRVFLLNIFNLTYKKYPCRDCGLEYPEYCMEFDHVGSKTENISSMLRTKRHAVNEEIKKTELVCILCHRKRTHIRRSMNQPMGQTTDLPQDYRRKRIARNKQFIAEQKKHPCVVCQTQYETYQMDFDHKDPATKKYNISDMAGKDFSLSTIQKEIDKCILLCCLCHKKKTHANYKVTTMECRAPKLMRDLLHTPNIKFFGGLNNEQ